MTDSDSKPENERFSLHGMTPEEAIQKMFGVTERETTIYCRYCKESITGPALVGEEGEVRCPKCGTLVINDPHQA
jgi:hypothetical protein